MGCKSFPIISSPHHMGYSNISYDVVDGRMPCRYDYQKLKMELNYVQTNEKI